MREFSHRNEQETFQVFQCKAAMHDQKADRRILRLEFGFLFVFLSASQVVLSRLHNSVCGAGR